MNSKFIKLSLNAKLISIFFPLTTSDMEGLLSPGERLGNDLCLFLITIVYD